MSPGNLIELTAAQAAEAIAARELSPHELFEAYRQRARQHAQGQGLNCFTWVSPGEPSEASRPGGAQLGGKGTGESRDAGPGEETPGGPGPGNGSPVAPLSGVPVAVKDLFCTQGTPSQAGSRILEGYTPPYTATAVARLLEAGARLLAKTNQDEFAMGSSNENSAFGPVLNPWDPTRVPGGSSGGSAAAVAAGLAPWALGTDTGGSIRQPAALCGIVGMKPTYGSVSRYGMIAFASSLDQAGPMTRNVTDAALLLGHMVGWDRRDATSLRTHNPLGPPTADHLRGIRLGVPRELIGGARGGDPRGGDTLGKGAPEAYPAQATTGPASGEGGLAGDMIEGDVLDTFTRALTLAEELGAEIVDDISLPHIREALSAYYVLAPAEASSNLARYDGVRYGLRSSDAHHREDLPGMYERTRHDGFGREVKRRIMLGTYALSAGYYDAYYARAQRVRTRVAQDFAEAFSRVDLIATPTTPTVAFGLGEKLADPWAMYTSDSLTVPMSLAGIPAISIPCGLAQNLPVGLQLAGPAFSDQALLEAAHALERALDFDSTPARV